MPGTPHDSFFKGVFSQVEHARSCLHRILPPSLLRVLDLSSLELVPGSYIDPELTGSHSDLVFRTLLDGAEALLYLILEHQRTAQPLMSVRLHEYSGRIWSRWRRDHPNARRVPPILPIVVYNGQAPWTEPVRLIDAVDASVEVQRLLARHHPQLEFLLLDLSATPDAELRMGATLASLALLLLKHIDAVDLPRKLQRWFGLLRAIWRAPGGLHALQMVISYLVEASEAVTRDGLASVIAADSRLATDKEKCLMTIAQQFREQGRQIGLEEGVLLGARQTLLRMIEIRFGSLPDALKQRIETAEQVQIDKILQSLPGAADCEQLFE